MGDGKTAVDSLVFDRTQAARFLIVSVRKLDDLVQQGAEPFVRIGRQVRFLRPSLERWLRRREQGGRPDVPSEAEGG